MEAVLIYRGLKNSTLWLRTGTHGCDPYVHESFEPSCQHFLVPRCAMCEPGKPAWNGRDGELGIEEPENHVPGMSALSLEQAMAAILDDIDPVPI